MLTSLLLLGICLVSVAGYGQYKSQIPNGDHIPHPCKPNFIWHGVGHTNPQGGGQRNAFGNDFAAAGHKWTAALCRKDSDGDGLTNGQELGDPDCTWTPGSPPPRDTQLSHPGVCDPFTSDACKARNTWVDCSEETFKCDAIHQADIRNITIRFPRTKVPAVETSYVCFNFDLPSDQEYHLVATQPLIDNHNVMHHMVLTTCDGNVGLLDAPKDCVMGTAGCTKTISIWTLGMPGECFHPHAGFKFGKGGPSTVALQHHWTNPSLVDSWHDASGLILYYTPKLRRYNMDTFTLGQLDLNIPPGQSAVTETGVCTSRCTKSIFAGPIQVTSVLSHMHYLGIRENLTMTRPGQDTMTVVDDNPFHYDSPTPHEFKTPLTVHPGDELKVQCTYQSQSRDATTNYGPGSLEEMCFSVLWYFPAENITRNSGCSQWRDTDFCDVNMACFEPAQLNSSSELMAPIIDKVLKACHPYGVGCRSECPAAIREAQRENKCFVEMWDYMAYIYYNFAEDAKLLKFAAAMNSCGPQDHEEHVTQAPLVTQSPHATQMPSKPLGVDPGNMLLSVIKQLDSRPLLQNIVMNVNYNNAKQDD